MCIYTKKIECKTLINSTKVLPRAEDTLALFAPAETNNHCRIFRNIKKNIILSLHVTICMVSFAIFCYKPASFKMPVFTNKWLS